MKKTKMLKKNYEFSKVFSKGKYYSGKTIEAFILNNRESSNYLGLAISRKSGHAVQRNRAKRLIRENYKILENKIYSGYSIIFLWKKKAEIKEAEYHQINKDMIYILKKAKVIELSENEENFNKNN